MYRVPLTKHITTPPLSHKPRFVLAKCKNDKSEGITNEGRLKNNIRLLQHQIQNIMMNKNANKADISELEDLSAALNDEKRKLKELEKEHHNWYDEIYYREYD